MHGISVTTVVQSLHHQLLAQSVRGDEASRHSMDASALPISVREAAFVEAADCFAALIARPQVSMQLVSSVLHQHSHMLASEMLCLC